MEQRNNQRRPSSSKPTPVFGILLAAVILGVCIIIAGANVNSAVKNLTAAVEAQTFSSTLSSPSTITVKSNVPKNYFTEKEAAEYLNMTADEVKAAITKGEIDGYIKTSAGYSISQKALDDFFEQRVYDTLQNNKGSESSES